MLVLTRRRGESVSIGENITVTVLYTNGNKVRLGVEAPRGVSVDREEVREAKRVALPVVEGEE